MGRLELRMGKRRPKVRHGLSHRVVHEYSAATDTSMQLRRDIAWLSLHPIGVRLPRCEECRDVCFRDVKDVDQDHRLSLGAELLKDRGTRIEWCQLNQRASPFICG
jgi:hypothetical protein